MRQIWAKSWADFLSASSLRAISACGSSLVKAFYEFGSTYKVVHFRTSVTWCLRSENLSIKKEKEWSRRIIRTCDSRSRSLTKRFSFFILAFLLVQLPHWDVTLRFNWYFNYQYEINIFRQGTLGPCYFGGLVASPNNLRDSTPRLELNDI